jgi:hypothetical protein
MKPHHEVLLAIIATAAFALFIRAFFTFAP